MKHMKHANVLLLAVFSIVVVVVAIIVYASFFSTQNSQSVIASFEDCVKAGNPVMESSPPRCRTQDGKVFVGAVPKSVEIKGEIVCLPHKDTSGPITLECAYGIRSADGKHYALKDTDPEYNNIASLPTGEVAVITGKLIEEYESKYDIVGIIEIESVEN